jgi:hypothetical protein
MIEIFEKYPPAKDLVTAYIDNINLMLGIMPTGQPLNPAGADPNAPLDPNAPQGNAGSPMANANREMSSTDSVPQGNGQGAQNAGPI